MAPLYFKKIFKNNFLKTTKATQLRVAFSFIDLFWLLSFACKSKMLSLALCYQMLASAVAPVGYLPSFLAYWNGYEVRRHSHSNHAFSRRLRWAGDTHQQEIQRLLLKKCSNTIKKQKQLILRVAFFILFVDTVCKTALSIRLYIRAIWCRKKDRY